MFRKRFSAALRDRLAVAAVTVTIWPSIAAGTAHAQAFNLLHSFRNVPDGGNPNPVITDAEGNLYGTTEYGGIVCGANNESCGTVFKLDSSGKETVLHRFAGGADGSQPIAGLVRDAQGNLYGTTQGNGLIPASSTIFKISPDNKETVLYTFKGTTDGCCENSALTLDWAGNIYGISPYAGKSGCGPDGLGCGTVFKVSATGKFSVLHTFNGADGIKPDGGLVRDAAGNLYGTTFFGGDLNCLPPTGCGTVFKLDAKNNLTVLYSFTGKADGANPLSVILDAEGNLYGITPNDGDTSCFAPFGCGTIFKVDTSGNFSVLYTFNSSFITSPTYVSHLAIDSAGNIFGATPTNGSHNDGFVFELDANGNFINRVNFPAGGGPAGSQIVGLFMDSDTTFYGSMSGGGKLLCGPPQSHQGCGTVVRITF
jgi:uncharacterized repeat protein (TIGR03803 family)